MKKLAGAVLLLCAGSGLLFAQPKPRTAQAAAKTPSVSQEVQQLEHDWADAAKNGNADGKLDSIIADDWVGLGYGSGNATKKTFIAEVKSGAVKIESFEFGPMNVKVLGNVAVVQGSDTEKSSYHGKDSSGKYVWMDVFVKRDGKWMAVRSQNAMASK